MFFNIKKSSTQNSPDKHFQNQKSLEIRTRFLHTSCMCSCINSQANVLEQYVLYPILLSHFNPYIFLREITT